MLTKAKGSGLVFIRLSACQSRCIVNFNHHHHHHHHQFNAHECSMKNKIHDKTHKNKKMIQKDTIHTKLIYTDKTKSCP